MTVVTVVPGPLSAGINLLDMDAAEFADFLSGTVTNVTPTQVTVVNDEGWRLYVQGTGFGGTAPNGWPTSGTITAISAGEGAQDFLTMTGLSISVQALGAALFNNNDAAAINLFFGGGDTMNGAVDDDDSMDGYGGNDVLNGNGGDDVLAGGFGADTLNGGDGHDRAVFDFGESGLAAGVTFDASTLSPGGSTVLQDGLGETDSLSGIEAVAVVGTDHADRIVGSTGDDWLEGEVGADTLVGGAGYDLALYDLGRFASAGVNFNASVVGTTAVVNQADPFGAIDRLEGVEGVWIFGSGYADTMTGSNGNDRFETEDGNDRVFAGGGNDYVFVTAGDVSVVGGDGDDTVYFAGRDAEENDLFPGGASTVVGGAGMDHVILQWDFNGVSQGVTLQLTDAGVLTANLPFVTSASGTGIERVTAFGSVAGDYLTGGSGADVFTGDTGADTLVGGSGLDWLDGGDGADTLVGGLGADVASGGAGNDLYLVHNDADTILEGLNGGFDAVWVGLNFILPENVEKLVSMTSFAVELTGNTGDNEVVGNNGGDVLRGLAGSDLIEGNGGHDLLYGGFGVDVLRGGAGNDRLLGEQGIDLAYGGAGDDIFFVFNEADQVFESADEGFDTVFTDMAWTAGANIEKVVSATQFSVLLTGNALGNELVGNGGDDTLRGLDGSDVLEGRGGNDLLEGGANGDGLYGGDGNDTLDGGLGNDFLFGAAGIDAFLVKGEGVDTLAGFVAGQDDVVLSTALYGAADAGGGVARLVVGAGAVATSALATLLFDPSTGQLRYDADGTGAGAAVLIARFTGDLAAFSTADLLFGP